jgi:conjugal transfer/entry exclusion protein
MAEIVNTPSSVHVAAPFATEFAQLGNWGQLLSVNLTAASQRANEIQQLQNSIRNLVLLPNQIFGPIQADINV